MEAQAQASGLMAMLSMLAIGFIGPHADFTASERALIEAPLARLLQQAGRAAAIGKYADPIMLAFGLGMWGLRVSGAQAQIAASLRPKPAPAPIAPPPPPVAVAQEQPRGEFMPAGAPERGPLGLDYLNTFAIGDEYGG